MVDLLKPTEIPKIPQEQAQKPSPEIVEKPQAAPQEQKEQIQAPKQPRLETGAPNQVPQKAQTQANDNISQLKERVPTPHTKSERVIEIEKIMTAGLDDIYKELDPNTQQTVKTIGEEAASQIEKLIEEGQNIAKKVLSVLRGWLKKIPGVNIYFLEQESKRKTDKIMAMARKTKGE
ncbi:hypothetical protein CL632_01510 [bacterium]|jgi:hypothetical protein|nr:hypothetical protein [bacterium]MDP6571821.1 hypothetical protein [Patescibacteria group bacterium]MDP6756438.1 hypothetical protein [Patescibacteria group bacterium]|tara:strand:- start:3133 stop:3663 length:531 start_codon:yes stop_codon:yes gene_type:complete